MVALVDCSISSYIRGRILTALQDSNVCVPQLFVPRLLHRGFVQTELPTSGLRRSGKQTHFGKEWEGDAVAVVLVEYSVRTCTVVQFWARKHTEGIVGVPLRACVPFLAA